jgi:hypothetical protein
MKKDEKVKTIKMDGKITSRNDKIRQGVYEDKDANEAKNTVE